MFFGAGVRNSEKAITKLYKNLSYATLSGGNNFNFDAISYFISRLSFSIKESTLANIDRKEVEDAKKAKEIIDSTNFVELPDPFEQDIFDDLFKDLEHEKNCSLKMLKLLKHKHRSQTVISQNLNRKVNSAATEQKSG